MANTTPHAMQLAAKVGYKKTIQRKFQDAQSVIQRDTTVKLTTQDYEYEPGKKEKVGHKMESIIDPTKKKSGTSPGGSEIKNTMDAFYSLNYRGMIRGHLMNGQLGGPGVAANLFPITSKANSEHKFEVENSIKEAIKKGTKVEYKVTAETSGHSIGGDGNPDATFKCEVKDLTGTKHLLTKTIHSEPKKSSTGTGWTKDLAPLSAAIGGKGGDLMAGARRTFLNKYLPAGWGEGGSGRGKGKSWGHVDIDNTTMKDS